MPRPRDPRRDEAKVIWLKSNGEMKLVDLAEQMNVTPSTVRKWKAQDKWDNDLKGSAPKSKRSALKRSRGHPGGQPGNQNAAGHGAPAGNQNATKFGFFAKYLPAESVEIMQQVSSETPADMLWDQIMIQYTAIIRAQKIMHVKAHDDLTKVLKREKETEQTDEREYEIQFAWDKQANFLMAQSKAMAELRNLIKQFLAIAAEHDERHARVELMRAQIAKVKADTARIKGDDQDDYEDDGFLEALKGKAADVWNDQPEDAGDSDANT